MVNGAQVVVQRPECLQILRRDGLEVSTRFEHVHAGFSPNEVLLHAFGLPIEKSGSCAEEEDYGGCKGPVAIGV